MKTKVLSKSSKFLSLATAIGLALMALYPISSRANTIALEFTNHTNNTNSSNTWGWAFSLTTDVLLTDLGVFDGSFTDFGNGTGDGLAASHLVTIWTSAGAPVPGAQATVPAGTSATYVDGFRYVSLTTPLLLPMGDYVIGANYNGDGDVVARGTSGISTASGVVYGGDRFGPSNTFPSQSTAGDGNFGPNFQFTAVANGVPEGGSSWILLATALAGMFGLRRLRQIGRCA